MKNILILILVSIFSLNFNIQAQTYILPQNPDYEKGRIRIKLKRENLQTVPTDKNFKNTISAFDIQNIDNLNNEIGIKRIERVFPFSIKFEAKHRKYGLHLWYELEFDENLDAKSIAEKYALLEEIEIAKPLYKTTIIDGSDDSLIVFVDQDKTTGNKISKNTYSKLKITKETGFNDPLLQQQWHYENDGTVGDKDVDIDLFKAWDKSTGNKDIIVAIVDGGIDINHEDLKDNLWENIAEINGEEGVDDDGNGYVDDYYGYNFVFKGALTPHSHGTHVAGTVSAVNNNGIGVAGVAGGNGSGNGVRLMSCQIFDDRGGEGNKAAAIVYGADNGAIISQNSWGYTQPGFYEPEVKDAINYFIHEAGNYEGSLMKGGIVFFAAGNTGKEETHYPGTFDEVVAVASTGPTGYPAPYSTNGDWVDLSAPGGDQAYYGTEGGILSTLPDNKYGFYQGTSMATPHVSGVAALAIAYFGGDKFTSDELRKIIINSTTPFVFESNGKYGAGNLNAALALSENKYIPPEPITDLRAEEVFHNEVRIKFTVPKDSDDYQPAKFYLALSQSEITKDNFDKQHIYVIANYYDAGTELALTIQGLIPETDYWIAVKSVDKYENISEISNILNFTTTEPPHFSESHREVAFAIDITKDTVKTLDMTFANTGSGIVYWNTFTVNEKPFYVSLEDWDSLKTVLASANKSLGVSNETQAVLSLTSQFKQTSNFPDYFEENDLTVYTDYYTYVSSNPTNAIGTGNSSSGLIFGTKFQATRGNFNMTHVTVGLLSVADKPLYVEIRKGENFDDAKITYVQKYSPDTALTNQLNYAKIPLYEPQFIEKDEFFWIVLYFDKEETYPLLCHNGYVENTFIASLDNGITFEPAEAYYTTQYKIPILYAASTGEDGSYVFLDPVQGEIAGKEIQTVSLTVDARNLANGEHLSTVGINTSDINKPGISIKVKVFVKGQIAALELADLYKYEAYVNTDNELELKVRNSGLDSLFIYALTDQNGDTLSYFLDEEGNSIDTLALKVNEIYHIPFIYNPSATGVLNPNLTLKTSIGDFNINTEIKVTDAPQISTSLSTNNITVPVDGTAELTLTIQNTQLNPSMLNYNMEKYNPALLNNGLLTNKLSYTLRTSDDAVNPVTSKWIDIREYADTSFKQLPNWIYPIDMRMKFPMYNSVFDVLTYVNRGALYFRSLGWVDTQAEASENSRASGYVFAIAPGNTDSIRNALQVVEFSYYDFGNKIVFYNKVKIRQIKGPEILKFGEITYETILYRDGAVEFHYIDVDAIDTIPGFVYAVGIQGFTYGEYVLYKDFEDTHNIHSGMVVRIEPTNDINFISVLQNRTGSLASGNSQDITLLIDPSIYNLVGGKTYVNTVMVESDAPVPATPLSLTVNVTGTPGFTTQDSLFFKKTHIGFPSIAYLNVKNTEAASGEISSVSFSNPDFSIGLNFPYTIAGDADDMIPVQFDPATSGNVTASMTINFSDGSSKTVQIKAQAIEDPDYTLSLAKVINETIPEGEKIKIPFTINVADKGTDLEYTFFNSTFAKIIRTGVLNGSTPQNDSVDLYGYTWDFSDSNKIFYRWRDIKSEGAEKFNIEYNEQLAFALPFNFPYYGDTFDTIWISRNGYAAVIKPTKDDIGGWLKPDDGIKGTIAPFFASLIPGSDTSAVWVLSENDRVIILWDGYRGTDVSSSGGNIYFQLEIVNNGSIYFHYLDIDKYTHMLDYGIESPDEKETFEDERTWILNWGRIHDTTSVAIAPPLHGVIKNNTVDNFELELSAAEIYRTGSFKDTIILSTNSYTHPADTVLITINTAGKGELFVTDMVKWEEIIYNGANTSMSKTIKLANKGHDVLEISNITKNNIDEFKLFDEAGNEISKTSTGILYNPIVMEPWDTKFIKLEVISNKQEAVNGSISYSGDFDTKTTQITANVVPSPEFVWDASDQTYELNNTSEQEYSFTMQNTGQTTLKYNLVPAVIPSGDSENKDSIINEIGKYTFDQPNTVDSIAFDTKESVDGYETPKIPTKLAFAIELVAPKGGFYLTHVKVNGDFRKIDEYIRIEVYQGADTPMLGALRYRQDFITYQYVEEDWVYFPLEKPVVLEEGQKYYIVVIPPSSQKYLGYEIAKNEEDVKSSWAANRAKWLPTGWNWQQYTNMLRKYKIRALTAAGDGMWLELDNMSGEIKSNETVTVSAKINPVFAGTGSHKAVVKAKTNDVNNLNKEFNININVNGAPVFDFYPNMYSDSIIVKETEELTVNYLFSDPENEQMTISLDENLNQLAVEFKQTGTNTAQVTFSPGYDDSGRYLYPVTLTDTDGNIVKDTIKIWVEDKNRAPELNPEYSLITLNMAETDGGHLSIPANELFTDPDNDELQILAGNYTPDIVDMALGYNYIDLHALQTGTGFVVFGADDGKENGFVVYGIYVQVIDDESLISSEPDGFGNAVQLIEEGNFAVYPNPVKAGMQTNIIYRLEEDAIVGFEVYDIKGAKRFINNKKSQTAGIYSEQLDVSKLPTGIYICRLQVNGKVIETSKFIVE